MYVGVHVPLGRESKRRHRHRGHKHHRKRKERDSEEGKEDGRESPSYGWIPFLTYNTEAYSECCNGSSLYNWRRTIPVFLLYSFIHLQCLVLVFIPQYCTFQLTTTFESHLLYHHSQDKDNGCAVISSRSL